MYQYLKIVPILYQLDEEMRRFMNGYREMVTDLEKFKIVKLERNVLLR